MRKKTKLVYGVGINDHFEPVNKNGDILVAYDYWHAMLRRCYSTKYHIHHPTYIGCTVCKEWLIFSNFKRWFDENYRDGFQLDKDILVKGNKVYSPDTCCFVSQHLNTLITSDNANKGVIVRLPNDKIQRRCISYQARCMNCYGKVLTKTFKTIEEAVAWYSATKKRVVAEQVKRALDEGAIDQRIADALLSREF